MPFQSRVLATYLNSHFNISQSRVETLCRLVSGVLASRTVNLAQLACLEPGQAKVSSAYRRLQRFFGQVSLDELALAKALVGISGLKAPYQLCLDRTNWKLGKHDINYLVLSVTTAQQRFPVFWDVLDAGSSNHKQCLALLDRWLECFDVESIGVLLADREFVGNQWLSGLVTRKIPFIIRMKDGVYAELEDGRCATLRSLTNKPTERGRLKLLKARLPKMVTIDKEFPLYFAAKQRKDGERIVVATNLVDPEKALKFYRERWRIECQFADWKRRGLNLEDTHLRGKKKLGLLLAIVAIASLWAQTVTMRMPRKQKPKRNSQGYLRQSYFRAGWDQIRAWAQNDFDKLINSWKRMWKASSARDWIRVV